MKKGEKGGEILIVGKKMPGYYLCCDKELRKVEIYGLDMKVGECYMANFNHFEEIKEEELKKSEIEDFEIGGKVKKEEVLRLKYQPKEKESKRKEKEKEKEKESPKLISGLESIKKGQQYMKWNIGADSGLPVTANDIFDHTQVFNKTYRPTEGLYEGSEAIKRKLLIPKDRIVIRDGDGKNPRSDCNFFMGNFKITGTREFVVKGQETKINKEITLDMWNDIVYQRKVKMVFWNIKDGDKKSESEQALIQMRPGETASFIGVYHLEGFTGKTGQVVMVVFDSFFMLPYKIITKADKDVLYFLSNEGKKENNSLTDMVEISEEMRMTGRDYMGIYVPFVLDEEMAKRITTISHVEYTETMEDESHQRLKLQLEETNQNNGVKYQVSIWNADPSGYNPIFVLIKGGNFRYCILN